jgi:membrane protease YdiL (CAAX protease family)
MPLLLNEAPTAQRVLVICVSTLVMSIALVLRQNVNVWLTTGLAAVIALGACLYVNGAELKRLAVPHAREVCHGIAYGALMAGLTQLAYPIAKAVLPGLSDWVEPLYGNLRQPPGPYWALPILVLVVVAEECIWRGLLIDMLQRRYADSQVVLLSTALYAVPHLCSGSWLLVGVVLVCGVIWSRLRVMTGSLVVPLLTHLIWDLGVFVLFPLD